MSQLAAATFSVIFASLVVADSSVATTWAQDRSLAFDTDQAFETQVSILVKRFWIAARQHHGDKMRETIDPQYLAMHDLVEGDFTFPEIATSNLYDVKIADDKSTVLCQIEKEPGSTTVVLLRLVQREDELFLQPAGPPDTQHDIVVPWLLHTKLAL